MTLLRISNQYLINSLTDVQTSSTTLVDDTQAEQQFNLDSSKTVLVIYSASKGAEVGSSIGQKYAINVDEDDYGTSRRQGDEDGRATGTTTFWVGTLGVGSHTIKGRFASNESDVTVTISERTLFILICDGDEYSYVENQTVLTTDSDTFQNDTAATIAITPSASCVALVLYHITNLGATEHIVGKKGRFLIDSTPYFQAEQAGRGWGPDYDNDSIFVAHALNLNVSEHDIQGQFASNVDSCGIRVDQRQLAVLLFDPNYALMNVCQSDIEFDTNSGTFVDDTQATIERTITDNRKLFVIAIGTKRQGILGDSEGFSYGIYRGSDRTYSRSSAASTRAISAGTVWAESLVAGAYTIKGRTKTEDPLETIRISSRTLIAFWLWEPLPKNKIYIIDKDNNLFRVNPSDLTEEKTLNVS